MSPFPSIFTSCRKSTGDGKELKNNQEKKVLTFLIFRELALASPKILVLIAHNCSSDLKMFPVINIPYYSLFNKSLFEVGLKPRDSE
jgi:hypothetical protein